MNIVEKIFSYKKDKEFKTWRLFGIKIKKRYRRCNKSKPFPSDEINRQLCLQSLYSTHGRIFPQFKNINNGKDVVIVATGPTLAKYKSIKDAVHIGVNRAYQFNKIKLQYLFMLDGTATKSYIDEIDKLDDIVKFYGLNLFKEEYRPGVRIPEYHLKSKNSYRCYTYNYQNMELNTNLEVFPLYNSASIAFAAIHFALYTHPKRIFLVGCDSNSAPYWDGGGREQDYMVQADRINNIMLDGYKKLKRFAQICYPDVEIISINPVGLKGLFKDVYTEDGE